MLLYVTGAVVTAAGALLAAVWLRTLARRFAWPRRWAAAAEASPATTPGARRHALNNFWCSVVLTINGMLLILSAHSDTAARIGIVTGSALLIWMLGALVMSRRQHRSAA